MDSDADNLDNAGTNEEEKAPVPSAGSEEAKDPTPSTGSEDKKDPDLSEGGEDDVTNVSSEGNENEEPGEGEEPGEDEAPDETELTIEALLEANPTATVSVYTQKVEDGVAQDLANEAMLTVGYVSQKAPAALGEGKTFLSAYAIVGGENKTITAVAVMDGERYVETDGALVKLGVSDLIVLKYTEAAQKIPMAPRRMAKLRSGEEIVLLDLSYVSVYTQKVVGDVSLTPVEAGSIVTGSFSATAPSFLGAGKTYLGAYVHKGGIDGDRYAVYAVEVDAEDENIRYVTMADGQTGMTALDPGDVLVIQYSEVPNTGSVTFEYTLDGTTLDPGADDFPLLPTNNLTEGKYDSDVDLKIWLPRQIGYDYIDVNSITLTDTYGNSVVAESAGVNNLFTVSAEQLKTLSGDLTATVSLSKNLQEANFFFSGANSVWIMPTDGHFRNGGSNQNKMDHGSNEPDADRTFYYTPYSQSVTFELRAFLQWEGESDRMAGKKLNKISIDGVNLTLPDAKTANSSASTPIGGGYEVVVTCIEPGDTTGAQYTQGAPRYTVTLTAPNGSLVHGNFNISTNYKNATNSFEIWANQLDGVGNIVKIENNGGSWNPYKDSQGKDAETQLRPNGNGFWRRDNSNTTKIFAKIQDGYSWDDDSWDVALLISSSLVTLPRARDGGDYSQPCYYIETSESSGADRGSVIINLPANMDVNTSDDIRIIIKGNKRNVQIKYDLNGGSWKAGETDPAQRLSLTLDQYGFNLTSQVPTKIESGQELVFTGWKLDTGTEVHPSGDLYTTNETVFSSRPIVDNAFTFTFVAQWTPKDQEHTTPYTINVTALDKDGNKVTLEVPTWEEEGIAGKRTYLNGNKIIAKAGLDPDKYISVPTNVLTKVLEDNDTFNLLFVEEINPQITVTKTTTATAAKPGDKVTYTITVKNTGDVAINTTTTPSGITVTDSKIPNWSQTITELAVGGEVSYTDVECTIPSNTQPGDFTNLAQASGTFVDTRYTDSDGKCPEYNLTDSGTTTITIQVVKDWIVEPLTDVTYNGTDWKTSQENKLVVKDKDSGNELTLGTDFEIQGSRGDTINVTTGGVTITIKGKDGTPYAGKTATVTYHINPVQLTITADSPSKTYDGSALTGTASVTSGTIYNEEVTFSVSGSQTNTGYSDNTVSYKVASGKEANYNVTAVNGTLTVNPAPLKVKTESAEKPYDGTPLTKSGVEVTGLVNNENPTFTATGSQTLVGDSTNDYTVDWGTVDQNNYTITEDLGTLTVTDTKDDGTPVDGVVTKTHDGNNFPLDATITFSISVKNIYAEDKTVTLKEQTGVTITTVSVEGEEDSRPITPGEEITVGNVPAGKTITATATYTVKSADVTAGKFHNEVTASFSGDKTFKGTDEPTIKKAYGLAAEDPDNVVYSGNRQEEKPKTVTDATTGATLTEGDDYRLEWPENCTDATGDGFITVQVIGINDYDGQNTTVTYQITPAPLTITTDSDTKTYDGTALTKPGVNITGLKNGETVAATATGTQTNYGHSENGYTLDWNAAGTTAKQSNYEIKEENLGTLTVNKLKLTIKADDATKTYDGTALTKDSYTVTGGTLVEGDLTITVTGSRTNAGDSVNQLTVTVAKGKEGNYEITSQNGTLTVEKAPLTITTGSATKVYDGTALTCDTITVTGLVDGEATYKTTGTRTDVGKSENNYELTWTGGKESNYNITATLGTLTVTETGTVVTKTHAEGTYKAGDVVTFTITVTNPYEEAKDITVTEQDDVTITNITVDKVDYTFTPGKEVTVSNVQSKGVVNITATYTLKPADGTAGSYKNEVTVDINGNSFKDDDTVTVQKELKGENPEDVVYNGTTQEQEPVVKDKNSGTVLTKGTDYTLSYSEDTTNVGTVTVTITGMGEYLGSSDTVTYQITRRLLNVLTGTNSWKYDSYEHKEESFTVYDSEKNVVTALPGQDEGKTLSLTGYASQTLVGEKDNSAACGTELVTGTLPSGSSVTDLGEQKDTVTLQNYTVNLYYGTLKVTDGTDEDPVDPDLVVTKTHDETTAYKEGDEVTFTIEVTNIYDKPMKITLVEQDGMTMVKEDAPEGTTPTKSLEFKEVQPGDTVSAIAKYTITKADVESGTFSNKVTAKFDKKNFETTDTVKLTGLTVVKSLATINGKTDLTNAKVGDTVTYTITVTNNGEDALENVTVTDKLTTAKFDSVEDDNIQVDGNTCTIQSLAGKSTVTLTVTYQVLDEDVPEYEEDVENSGKLVNKVTAKAGEDGPEGGDKEVTPVARLEVSKDLNGDNETVKVGEEITYTITVKNTGSVELTNIQVEDDLETAVISDGTGYTVGKENKNTAEISSLAAGKTVTLTVTYTVLESDVKAGYLTNVATATAPNGPKDDDKEVTPVPGLKVMKTTTSSPANGSTYALGETITYAITVKNTGNEALTGITVTDELTGDTWTIASLGSGATTEAFTASHKVTEDDILAGKVVNVATAKTDDPDGPEGTGTTEDDTDDIDTTLEVKKEADKDKAVEGEKVTYTITVENKGNVDYTNVVVSDGLDGAKITSINAKNGYTSNDNGSITLKKLEVGETAAITVAYTITEADAEKGTVHNVATAKGDPIPDPADPDKPKTPEGKDEEDVDTEPMDTTLTVTKIADKDKAKAGETITYTITVKNDGNVDYKNVVVTDQFLAKDGESFVSGAAITKVAIGGKTVKVTDGSSSYTIDVLKAGETATITAEYTVQESDEGTITNVAIAKGETEDPDKVPEGGSDKVPTDVVFDLTVKKEWKGDSILTRPKSIKVTVFKDGIRYTDTVEITALGGWSAKFTVPKDGSAYTVAEEAVTGYTVKYSAMEGNTITITNTKQTKPGGGLLQTGQLNWPIPVLTFLGISMITGGAALTVGKKKDKYEG